MAYFPFYFELKDKKGIVIGGGSVALEKVQRLSSFNADITLIAPEILSEIKEFVGVKIVQREYLLSDLDEAYYVVAATDDEKANKEICEYCRAKKIPVNVVDDQEKCDFIFPSVIQRGPLVIGVSSSGASPQVAVDLRKKFEQQIPDNMEEILDYLASIRPVVKENTPDAHIRHQVFKEVARQAMELGRPLSEAEFQAYLKK